MATDCRNQYTHYRGFGLPARIARNRLAAILALLALFSGGTAMAERRARTWEPATRPGVPSPANRS